MLKILFREPLLHFLLIGGLLFLLYDFQNEDIANDRITVSEADIDRLISLWEKKRQRLPTQLELQALIDQHIRDEVMYREALAMGLDKNDSVVRKRLAQKIEFITSDIAASIEPSDKELIDYLKTHPDKFETPAQISFEHIYFNNDKRGVKAESDAQQLLIKLKSTETSIDTRMAGDPFMMGYQHDKINEHDVSRLFGKNFASSLFLLETNVWQGPVASGYGFHLVRINNKTPSKTAELSTVRDKVLIEWQADRRQTLNKAFYENLRQRYDIVIENNMSIDKLARVNQ